MRKKILISAYAISPVRGSEYGAAWNTVTHLATEHDLWVLYGMSDDHMGDTQTLKAYLKTNPLPSVNFIEVKAGKLAHTINMLNKWGLGWFFYFAYYLWQKEALKAAKEIVKTNDIDVVHQLGPIGFREPGLLGELDKPLVWGPIGGMRIIDSELLKNKSFLSQVKFTAKNTINYFQINHSRRIYNAFKRADVLIAATIAGQQTILEKFERESYHLSEMMVNKICPPAKEKFSGLSRQVQLVWSGSHIERKNFDLCLDALAKVHGANWMLNVLGSGPLTKKLQEKAEALGLTNHITWHGQVSRSEAVNMMASAHLHIITSIAEDNPSVIVEALAHGVPTLTIDHCGMGDVICNRCGIKILPGEHEDMAGKMAGVIDHLLINPQILESLAYSTLGCAKIHLWEKRSVKLNRIYNEAIEVYENGTQNSFINKRDNNPLIVA